MKVYVVISGRIDFETRDIEVWDDEEIAKVRIRRIKEQELEEVKNSAWGNKKIKVNEDENYYVINWINSDNEKRRFLIYYKEVELKG